MTYNPSLWYSTGNLLDNVDSLSWGVVNAIEESNYAGTINPYTTTSGSAITDFAKLFGAGYVLPEINDYVSSGIPTSEFNQASQSLDGIGVGATFREWH